LAPSAAAAAQLRDQTGAPSDTLAKLTWSLQHRNGEPPEWIHRTGPSTLVLIDEAGMADTLTLDTAVQFIVGSGGSVRLIGDDQQLAAIGAAGVLRDIEYTHGAVRLTELHRFHNPAEAAASLALRDGRPEALGFYLDRQRIHIGDLATLNHNLFDAWRADNRDGLDSIMLAPTRDLVAELNQRARAHRLATTPIPGRQVALAEGNRASAGELIITRSNDRRLRISTSDWVKNGDRWTVVNANRDGGLRVQHRRTGSIQLPASYVRESVELGYATTIHTAQGITADTMHGLITGNESRQQLYTMCTRGRLSNHIYLQLVGDGDPHTLIRPDTIRPATATELLEHILPETTPQDRPAPCCESSKILPSGSASPSTLHRRPTRRCRGGGRLQCGADIGGLCQPVGAWANRRTGMADPTGPSAPARRERRRPAPTAVCRLRHQRNQQRRRSSRRVGLAPRRHQPAQRSRRSPAAAARHSRPPCRRP
jgi:hypothetical protein